MMEIFPDYHSAITEITYISCRTISLNFFFNIFFVCIPYYLAKYLSIS